MKISGRRLCRVLGQYRFTQRRLPRGRADEECLVADMIELTRQHGRYPQGANWWRAYPLWHRCRNGVRDCGPRSPPARHVQPPSACDQIQQLERFWMPSPRLPFHAAKRQIADACEIARDLCPVVCIKGMGPDGLTFEYPDKGAASGEWEGKPFSGDPTQCFKIAGMFVRASGRFWT